MVSNKVCLIVIDGWGISDKHEGNAIYHATTPVMDALCQGDGYTTLDASGLSVGLPDGLMGNSEVGHLNIGAGRVVYQDIVRINMAIKQRTLLNNQVFLDACNYAKEGSGRIHYLGLVSDGGVHSHIDHLLGLLELTKLLDVPKCFVHFFADGRDTRPTSAVNYLKQVQDKIEELQYGSIATVMGRYYAMDRDKRHERIKIAYEGLTQGIGQKVTAQNVIEVIQSRYDANGEERQTDEFLKPIILNEDGVIRDGDSLIFIDFRSDRMRQIVEAFAIQRHFETAFVPKNLKITCMTEYKKEFGLPVLFSPDTPKNVLAEVLSSHKIKQYHCAETEKYAHVTFFFNGGVEKAFELEERKLVPSPKVATYDLKPEMSAHEVGQVMVEAISSEEFPFVMCNFAPPDMVGHTGVYEPTIKACEVTDKAIGAIQSACLEHGYTLMVTSDHGNAEQMFSEQGGPHTAHTTNRVPFCVVGRKFRKIDHNAALCDVAVTVLQEMGIEQPKEMTGQALLCV